MYDLQPFMKYLYHKVVKKNGIEYPVWVCTLDSPEDVVKQLKELNKSYIRAYGIPLIGFEK